MPVNTGKFVRHQGKLILPGVWGSYQGFKARVIDITETFDATGKGETKIVLRWYTPKNQNQDPPFEIIKVRPEDRDLVID